MSRAAESALSICDLIAEGLAANGILPQYDRVQALDALLRAELNRLLPIVQAHTDDLDHGTAEWDSRQRILDSTRVVLRRGLGTGLRSAALQVHELARHCSWLVDQSRPSPAPGNPLSEEGR